MPRQCAAQLSRLVESAHDVTTTMQWHRNQHIESCKRVFNCVQEEFGKRRRICELSPKLHCFQCSINRKRVTQRRSRPVVGGQSLLTCRAVYVDAWRSRHRLSASRTVLIVPWQDLQAQVANATGTSTLTAEYARMRQQVSSRLREHDHSIDQIDHLCTQRKRLLTPEKVYFSYEHRR